MATYFLYMDLAQAAEAHAKLRLTRRVIENEVRALLTDLEAGNAILIGGSDRIETLRALLAASSTAIIEIQALPTDSE